MAHDLSREDAAFRAQFESGAYPPAQFDHYAHVRLAYVYLAHHETETAVALMKDALLNFMRHHHIDPAKYHETITRAWVLAVRHFMNKTANAESADVFIAANPALLDTKIMLTHYSVAVLFSDEARARFVAPDLDHIPGSPPLNS